MTDSPSDFDTIMSQAGQRAEQAAREKPSGTVAAQVRQYVADHPDDNWIAVARAICASQSYDISAVHCEALALAVQVRSAYYRMPKAERGNE